jgi:hypothetical protein
VLAALANTDEPSPVELDLGRCSRSILPVPTLQVASLAVRLGMKRSAALYVILVFVGRDRRVTSFFALGVLIEVVVVPVPVSAHSDTPSSNRRGEERAMFDLGESRVVLETERWMRAMKLPPWIDSCASASGAWLRGVRGEGVNGIRPPAARVEKTEERLLTGVKTAVVAMTANFYAVHR